MRESRQAKRIEQGHISFYMFYMPYQLPSTEGGVGRVEKDSPMVASPFPWHLLVPCNLAITTTFASRREMPMVASYRDKLSADDFEWKLAKLGGAQALRDLYLDM